MPAIHRPENLMEFANMQMDFVVILFSWSQRHHHLTGQRGRPASGGRDALVTVHGHVRFFLFVFTA